MIAAVVLAAGRSTRMGAFKLDLPWKGGLSVIEHVVAILSTGGASPIVVVTGYNHEIVERALSEMEVVLAYNSYYATTDMLSSIKVGLETLETSEVEAALIIPGDLPLLKPSTVSDLIRAWQEGNSQILAPSFQDRRGHPILVGRGEWVAIQELENGRTLRDFLSERQHAISYVVVNDPGIHYDMDTPEDYHRALSEGHDYEPH
jgi:molybdenum cofactor cytidylyltransferase